MERDVRKLMIPASLLLFAVEVLIGLFAHGFLRDYVGDLLVVILLYTLARTVFPLKPKFGVLLPTLILLFAFGVEFLQLWGFCDRFGIENKLLRVIIGTGFSWLDMLCYVIGMIPCYICDIRLGIRKLPKS